MTLGDSINKENIIDETRNYEQKRVKYAKRSENSLLPKLALHNLPHGKKNTGRSRRRWITQNHMKVDELHRTGPIALNLQRHDDDIYIYIYIYIYIHTHIYIYI